MIEGYDPVYQSLLGTLFTWGLTAAGSALVFVFASGKRKVLDGSLGFAAGVMIAASYWSLLAPAIELAQNSGTYGKEGEWAFIPAAVGFAIGAAFVYAADLLMPYMGVTSSNLAVIYSTEHKDHSKSDEIYNQYDEQHPSVVIGMSENGSSSLMQRRKKAVSDGTLDASIKSPTVQHHSVQWKRIFLLILAITIHNIPEGLAVGVGFGAIGKTPSATFESARNLAIGIGIQNFPEGLAVSLPLRASGFSVWRSFWYGQLSGMVEPIAGVLGTLAVVVAEPVLPYALAFAAGAMVYVVMDDIMPEAHSSGNGRLASWGSIVGFIVMMTLDVGLG
ncbi:zinc transporter ZIP11-like [Anneissia japonica]|uniref:zinc transporter ZIP11-like n=1 Tax=Anneissia japonica TaxID=1529436 RepID=UPI00142582E9|nr:zinc transporter ZIP11-like [Anneissia japonica]